MNLETLRPRARSARSSTRALGAGALLLLALAPGARADRPMETDVVEAHLEPTLGSLGLTSWDLPGSALREDTVAYSVEASIAPAFTLFHTAMPGGLPGHWRLVAVPKVVLRRSDGLPSNPVRTPSYMPAATLYVEPNADLRANGGSAYFSLGLAHYSNGQTGSFLRADGSGINDVDGRFSLWSSSVGLHFVNDWPLLPEYKALRLQHITHKEGLLDEFYPDWIVSLVLHSAERAHALGPLGGRSRFTADFDWLPRVRNGAPEAWKPVPFAATLAARYAPDWGVKKPVPRGPLGGFALFARFRAGHDTYNMGFHREVYRFDLGLMMGPGV
jgi:hypothetical protein